MSKTYKCPSCGGPLIFDQNTQKLKCPYCGYEEDVKEFESSTQDTDETNLYLCASCGAEVLLETHSTASSCPFCDNPIVLSTKFSDSFKPDFIVPFQNKKEDIIEAFESHMANKKFLPEVFKKRNLLKEIKGIYVPYWVYDIKLEAQMEFDGETLKELIKNDKKYITRSFYDLYREANCSFKELPISASKKMDETMLDSIEPFNLELKVPFSPDYLSGFYAENYDTDQKDKAQHILKRTETTLEEKVIDTLGEYDELITRSYKPRVLSQEVKYTLLPVWFLTTRFQNEEYIFAMNGINGKLIGDLPFDKSLYRRYLLIRFIILFILFYSLFTWIA